MKTNSRLRYAVLLCVITGTTSVLADDIKITLSGSHEVPPVSTEAAGNGTLTINKDMSVNGGITTTGIVATMAHIHVGKAGANGPVAVTFTRNGDNGWVAPPGAKLTEAQYKAYQAGELYVNVHSEAHKGGEIRGQVTPPMAAPARMPGY